MSHGRHRDTGSRGETEVVDDHELTSYLAALAPDTDDRESTGSGKRFGSAQVYQLRMTLMASEQLKELAAERGTSPQALAQEWVLERLSWESRALSAAPGTYPEPQTDEHYFDHQRWEQPIRGSLR